MTTTNQSNYGGASQAVQTATALRKLYITRVIFSLTWIALVLTVAKTNHTLATILFIIYPAWDAVATYFDINANPATVDKTPQYINMGVSILTAIAVTVALQTGIPEALMVFGVWAFLAGLFQLIIGIRRRKNFEGQWPMIISGAQSMLAGVAIFAKAHVPNQGVDTLAGYSAFGAFYFALAAFRLGKTIKDASVTA
ncbi:Short repeat of unknown function [Pedobacter westerhofensis]|uniref:DUF308 domain-containing protein n=1 Tax=Pedobacter westerhofensis TaxID=425512 RepID=A0A521B4R6_9SPHI|nr:DUF308 domain-containing protein [Pedobacter westerhofensis]SMO42031.1 Short repeat of unknown function [Pedobacter westerhofensis]